MPRWITIPPEKLYYQQDQQEFLAAIGERQCPKCRQSFMCVAPTFNMCPACDVKGNRVFDRLTIIAGRRWGKGLALDTPIPTPTGWTTMDAIRVGDVIFNEQGAPTIVLQVSDINHIPCYRVEFSDGSHLIADEAHQWLVWSAAFRKAIRRSAHPVETPQVKTTPALQYTTDVRDAVPLCLPLQYAPKTLPIPPYTLGAWLGDGDSQGSYLTSVDPEIIANIEADGYAVTPATAAIRWKIGLRESRRDPATGRYMGNGSFRSQLRDAALLRNKHVPRAYLEASIDQRLELLRGLMDTDGYCDTRGLNEFTTTNERLADACIELVTGLGYRPSVIRGRAALYGKDCGPKWCIKFWAMDVVYKLSRKRTRQQLGFSRFFPVRYVAAVTPVPSVATKCIEVDSPSSLFLAGRACIPTHNSKIGSIAAVQEATIPNSVVWCCAPTNPKLHRYVLPALQQIIPAAWVKSWNAEFLDLRLINGSLIHLQTLEDPDQGRGQGLDALWIDEVCELSKTHWEVIRPSLAGDTAAFFTTSPQGYDWVYDELYKPAEDGLPGYWACHAKTAESANPRITSEFLAREKAQMSATMFAQEYEADFVIFTGAVYGSSIEPQVLRHDEDIRKIIPEWPQIASWRQSLVGIDTGADHPFGALKLVTTELGIVVVGEYLERDKTFVQHANAIKYMAGPNAKYAINRNERQPMLELAQHGIYCQPAENDIVAGTERVKSWLQQKQLWFIERMCPETLKQLKAYRWAENSSPKDDQKRKEKVFKLKDELPDCLRYAVMTYPMLPKPIIDASKPRDISALPQKMQDDIQRLRRIDKDEKTIKPQDAVGDFWV